MHGTFLRDFPGFPCFPQLVGTLIIICTSILFACWVVFLASFLSADFFKTNFKKNYFRNTIKLSNSLDPDQDTFCRCSSGSKLFAKVINRQQKSLLAREELINLENGSFRNREFIKFQNNRHNFIENKHRCCPQHLSPLPVQYFDYFCIQKTQFLCDGKKKNTNTISKIYMLNSQTPSPFYYMRCAKYSKLVLTCTVLYYHVHNTTELTFICLTVACI